MPDVKIGITVIELQTVTVLRLDRTRLGHIVPGVSRGISDLACQVVETSGTQRRLQRVVLRVGRGLEKRNACNIREQPVVRPVRLKVLQGLAGWINGLVDVALIGQLAALASYVSNLDHGEPGQLPLDIQVEVLNVRRTQILAHAERAKRRLRNGAA